MCKDSGATNKIRVNYRFPLSRMDDIMDYLSGDAYFTNGNLKSGYQQTKIRQGNE